MRSSTAPQVAPAAEPAPELPDWRRYHAMWRRLRGAPRVRSRLDWWGPLVCTLVGAVLRLQNLGNPPALVFDENYYVKQAYSLLQHGVELRTDPALGDTSGDRWNAGTYDIFASEGDLVIHPPLGKWLIALGQQLFGVENSWSWRIVPALAGIACILLLGRAVLRITRSGLWATFAAALMVVDGLAFVESRTGILDTFVAFFALAAFQCLLIDRDRSRELLAWRHACDPARSADPWGPSLGLRPWRLAAGLLLGCLIAVKWSGLVFLAVFGVMTVLWDMNARRTAGHSAWARATLVRDAPRAFVGMVGLSLVVYLASWVGWFRSPLGHGRTWATLHPATGPLALIPDPLRALIALHEEIWTVSASLQGQGGYSSKPWTWMLLIRPNLFFLRDVSGGECSPPVGPCHDMIVGLGTPSIWWLGILAIVVLALVWLLDRPWAAGGLPRQLDWRLGAALSGIVAGYLPWFFSGERTTYSFYIVGFLPWVIMCITVALHRLEGTDPGTRRWRSARVLGAAVLVASIVLFAFFWPVYTLGRLTDEQWQMRMWLSTWH